MITLTDGDYATYQEAADMFALSHKTLSRLVAARKVSWCRPGKYVLIRISDVTEWISNRVVKKIEKRRNR